MPSGGAIDLDKCYLGGLCKRGHDHEGTGKSLRRKSGRGCLICTRNRVRAWQVANPEKVREINARPENKAARIAVSKRPHNRKKSNEWRRRPEVRARWLKRVRERYASDPAFRIKRCLQARLTEVLRKGAKPGGVSKYGIDWHAIVVHLGPKPGPDYEVDHIRPLVSFDLSDPDQVKMAFAPENHQWLTRIENMRKGARMA